MLRPGRIRLHSTRIADIVSYDNEAPLRFCRNNLLQIKETRGFSMPSYDPGSLTAGVLNIGLGNFHMVHNAVFFDSLLNIPGNKSWGIVSVGIDHAQRRVQSELKIQDNLYTVVAKNASGLSDIRMIGSIIDTLQFPDESARIAELVSRKEIRMVTLAIDEINYHFDREFTRLDLENPSIAHDILTGGASRPFLTVAGILVAGLHQRFLKKGAPISILSCDNLSRNGEKARTMVESFALSKYPLKTGFHRWLSASVFYPNTVCDRICLTDPSKDRIALQQTFGVLDNALLTTEAYSEWVVEKWMGTKPEGMEDVGIKMVSSTLPYENVKMRLNYGCRLSVAIVSLAMGLKTFKEAMEHPNIAVFADLYMREASHGLGEVPKNFSVDKHIRMIKERIATPELEYLTQKVAAYASKKIIMDWKPVLESLPFGHTAPIIAFSLSVWIHLLARSPMLTQNRGCTPIIDCNQSILERSAEEVVATVELTGGPDAVNKFLTLVFGTDSPVTQSMKEPLLSSLRDINKLGIEEALRKFTSSISK